MNKMLQDLIEVLDIEQLEINLFRGQSRDLGGRSVFGGQVIGQGIVAASRTVEERIPHSLHAYFLRPGDANRPIVYEVDRVRDGGSFSTRRVQAIQNGAPILTMMVSFQLSQPGLDYQAPMPEVPAPDTLPSLSELRSRWQASHPEIGKRIFDIGSAAAAIEIHPVLPQNPFELTEPTARQLFWFRAAGRLPDAPWIHRCVLAYASDYALLPTSLLPHGIVALTHNEDLRIASIDHALWFHREARVDEWLLYAIDTPSSQGARGYSRGLIYDLGGRLIASVAQEGMIRVLTAPAARA